MRASGFLTLLHVACRELLCLPCLAAAAVLWRTNNGSAAGIVSLVLAEACVARQVERLLADLEAELARRYPQAVN